MARLITAQYIKTNTSMGGNVDPDKFMHLLDNVQDLILEPALGTALFDKIVTDFVADSLSGNYLILFNDYIKKVLCKSVYSQYLFDGVVLAQNTGIYENAPQNAQRAELESRQYIAKSNQSNADAYLERMNRFLEEVNITEYDNPQVNDYDINPREINTISGWYLPRTNEKEQFNINGSGVSSGNFLELNDD